MSFSDHLTDVLKEIEREIPLTWTPTGSDVAYPITAGNATDMRDLGNGGWTVGQSLLINIRRELFTGDIPKTNHTGVFSGDGLTYNIDEVTNPPGSPFIQLTLTDNRKGG